jgi:tripartite ATP-independent transporter DctP family solute receptor
MSRVSFERSLAAIMALVSVFAHGSVAPAAPLLVSIVLNTTPKSLQNIGADAMRDALGDQSHGHISIDERIGGFVGSDNLILGATQSGAVNVTVLSGSVVGSVVPEIGVFDIPFLFRDATHAKAVTSGPVFATIAAKFPEKGLVLLALGEQGFRNVTNSKHPIKTPADLAGLKIRLVPNEIYQMTFKALGAEPVPMEFPLVYGAMKDGRIDGHENPLSTIASNRFWEVQKYVSLTGHFFAPIAFVANRDFFQGLDAADKAALIAAARAGAEATWAAAAAADAKGLEDLRKGGMEITDNLYRQAFVDAVKPLEPEFEKRFGKDLIAEIRSTH